MHNKNKNFIFFVENFLRTYPSFLIGIVIVIIAVSKGPLHNEVKFHTTTLNLTLWLMSFLNFIFALKAFSSSQKIHDLYLKAKEKPDSYYTWYMFVSRIHASEWIVVLSFSYCIAEMIWITEGASLDVSILNDTVWSFLEMGFHFFFASLIQGLFFVQKHFFQIMKEINAGSEEIEAFVFSNTCRLLTKGQKVKI